MIRRSVVAFGLAIGWQPFIDFANAGDQPPERVYFASRSGISVWSSETQEAELISSFPSYEMEFSPDGELYVGNGGADCEPSGITTVGIFRIEPSGEAVLVCPLPADDLEFSPDGDLYASNKDGIFLIQDEEAIQVSKNATSQFAFDSPTTVVTTNGGAYAGVFSSGSERIDIQKDETLVTWTIGGDDIQVCLGGRIFLSGTSGIWELVQDTWQHAFQQPDLAFDFEIIEDGTVYLGATADYGGFSFSPGLWRALPGEQAVLLVSEDINSIEIQAQEPVEEHDFRRADVNADGNCNLTDPLCLLTHLFLGGPAPICLDAADADDDGVLQITDAIFSLTALFLGGPQPPAPGWSICGADPTADALTCDAFAGCP